jgi:hypothetical protein
MLKRAYIQSVRGPFLQECEREIYQTAINIGKVGCNGCTHQITVCLCRIQDSVNLFLRVLSTTQLFCSPYRGKFKSVLHFTCMT